jgi:hypothetical protein
MRLLEFQDPNLSLRDVLAGLGQSFTLERVGGNGRVYNVNGETGAVFIVNSGPKALGITWEGQYNLKSVYIWNEYKPWIAPDVAVDIPADATLQTLLGPLTNFIANPHAGLVESLVEDEQINVAPAGGKKPKPNEDDDIRSTMAMSDQLKAVGGGLALVGRNANGTYFELPHSTEAILNRLEGMLSQHFGPNHEGLSMAEQYDNLKEQVKLVAGGKSQFIKSLLITGAPSSGKTFNIVKSLDEMGFVEGKDFIKKKGKITPKALYRVLIEQVNGMLLFDDCDSVAEDEAGENMLKGALDTEQIREVDYDAAGSINTAVLSRAERIAFVDSVSRILRGKGTAADVEMNRHYLKKSVGNGGAGAPAQSDDDLDFDWIPADDQVVAAAEPANRDELLELQTFFTNHLPNKIEFQGRIIFISNKPTNWWCEAIRTRAFIIEMNFSDADMLQYIRGIKQYIHAAISEPEKDEVINYIEQLWNAGTLRSPINFRLVQAGFDLRLTSNWKKIIATF